MIAICLIVVLMQIFAYVTEAAECSVEKAKEVETKLKFRDEKRRKVSQLIVIQFAVS